MIGVKRIMFDLLLFVPIKTAISFKGVDFFLPLFLGKKLDCDTIVLGQRIF